MGGDRTDPQLIRDCQQGDQTAFAELVDRHQAFVYAYLRARLTQAADADDMTQDVFLRFYLARARCDSESLIRPWLLGIARNRLREFARGCHRRKEVAWTELCLDLETQEAIDDGPFTEIRRHVPECLSTLGPSARQAIESHYAGRQKLTEIAQTLARSEGAVKLLLHRARLALRACLDRKQNGDDA